MTYLLAYLISLAATLRGSALDESRRKKLEAKLKEQAEFFQNIESARPLREEVHLAAQNVAKIRSELGVSPREEPLFRLLQDETFQEELARWILAESSAEEARQQKLIADRMARALGETDLSPAQTAVFQQQYFQLVEKQVFSNELLSNWRQSVRMKGLEKQVAEEGRATRDEVSKHASETQAIVRRVVSGGDEQLTNLLHGRTNELAAQLAFLTEAVADLARRSHIDGSVQIELPPLWLEPPQLPPDAAMRRATVHRLVSDFADRSWIALHGAAEMGKTTLARLMIDEMGEVVVGWVRLEDDGLERPEHLVQRALLQIAECERQVKEDDSSEKDALLVIDNCPHLEQEHGLADAIRRIVEERAQGRLRLLTTSAYALPVALIHSLGKEVVFDVSAPRFDANDTLELLQQRGAPPHWSAAGPATFLTAVCSGHPLLLVATIDFLASSDWALSTERLSSLLRGDHSQGLTDDVLARLTETVEQPERELLYRLTIARQPFGMQDVYAVAGVEPAVDRPRERFATLVGTWIERESDQRYSLSPLIRRFAIREVAPDVGRRCHLVLAGMIVRARMNTLDAVQAVMHFFAGQDQEKGGVLFLLAMLEAARHGPTAFDSELLSMLWCDSPLPEGLRPSLQLSIRATQAALRLEQGRDTTYVLVDTDRLLAAADDSDGWAVCFSTFQLFVRHEFIEVPRLLFYLRYLLSMSEEIAGPTGAPFRLPPMLTYEQLLWWPVTRLAGREDIAAWFDAVELLPKKRRLLMLQTPNAPLGILVLADKPDLLESRKADSEQDWRYALTLLEYITSRGERIGWYLLRDAAVRARLIVRCRRLAEVAQSIPEAEAAYRSSEDREGRFLIAGEIGNQLVAAGRNDDAREWFTLALSEPSELFPAELVVLHLSAALAWAGASQDRAIAHAEQAVDVISRRLPGPMPGLLARASGELAVARFLQAESTCAAWADWHRAAEALLLEEDLDQEEWRAEAMVLVNLTAYLSSLASTGRPPEDETNFRAPEQGVLCRPTRQLAQHFSEDVLPRTFFLLGRYSSTCGDFANAALWYDRAVTAATERNDFTTLMLAVHERTPYQVVVGHYRSAILWDLRSLLTVWGTSQVGEPDTKGIVESVMEVSELPRVDEPAKSQLQYTLILNAVIPAAVHALLNIENEGAWAELIACIDELSTMSSMIWPATGRVLEAARTGELSDEEVLRQIPEDDFRTNTTLGMLAKLCAAESATLEAALALHLSVFPSLVRFHAPDTVCYEQILSPYVATFWTRMVANQRFRLASPDEVVRTLGHAVHSEPCSRIHSVLSAVALGVPSLRMPNNIQKWLHDGVWRDSQ